MEGLGMRQTNVTIYCHRRGKDAPLASVRYTKYDDLGKVIDVDQVDYEDKNYFHSEVLQAVNCGVDVLIYTHLDGSGLQKKIQKWT
jgi:hypothetical protein